MTIFFYITSKNTLEANKIAKALLKDKLIACANVYKNIDSFFNWKNKVVKSKEVIIMGKTKKSNQSKIIKKVKKIHSYDIPCVIFSKITGGNRDFLKWVINTSK